MPHILTVLRLLKTHPEYRFALDQMAYIKPFLERYPDQDAAFREYVAEGRLQIVGGTDIMPDVNMPSGESWARQALYGKSYFRDKVGVDVAVGWNIDTFGSHAQMPQLLKLAGYKSYWAFRGVPSRETPPEFLWQGIDGTQIPTFYFGQAAGFFEAAGNSLEFERYALNSFAALKPFTRGEDRVAWAMSSAVSEPDETLPAWWRSSTETGILRFRSVLGYPPILNP